MPLPVTAFVAAVCALLLLVTAIDTVRQRLRLKAAFGDHGDPKLISASRAHGNLAEYAPITIILLGLLETVRANHLALMIIGTGLVARVAAVSRCLAVPRLAQNFDTARELLGQLDPAGVASVELHTAAGIEATTADELGRFRFALPAGGLRLRVRRAGGPDLVTPWLSR